MTLFYQDRGRTSTTNLLALEHSLTVIGQLGRDINLQKDGKIEQLSPAEYKKSLGSTIYARNEKMHNVIHAESLPLRETILRDTLPMLPEVEAMRTIIDLSSKGEVACLDTVVLFTLGYSYLTLKKYDESIQYFETILKQLLNQKIRPYLVINAFVGLSTAYGEKAENYLKLKLPEEWVG